MPTLTCKNDTLESPFSNEEAAAKLRESKAELKPFGISLLENVGRGLSPNQWFWVHKLAVEIASRQRPTGNTVEIGTMEGIITLFRTAAEHLKWPKIVLLNGDTPIKLTVAGDRARFPGTINVVNEEDKDIWYGRVHLDGKFEENRRLGQVPEGVVSLLREFAADPAGVAMAHGIATGKCCFCNTPLSDERSLAQGYGPTCARHFGLDWGRRPVGTTMERVIDSSNLQN